MDATTQFDDIHHSKKAYNLMRDLYIGDFYNPEEEKESWEEYVRRRQKEDENQMSLFQKFVLIGLFLFVFTFLYNYIVETSDSDK